MNQENLSVELNAQKFQEEFAALLKSAYAFQRPVSMREASARVAELAWDLLEHMAAGEPIDRHKYFVQALDVNPAAEARIRKGQNGAVSAAAAFAAAKSAAAKAETPAAAASAPTFVVEKKPAPAADDKEGDSKAPVWVDPAKRDKDKARNLSVSYKLDSIRTQLKAMRTQLEATQEMVEELAEMLPEANTKQ